MTKKAIIIGASSGIGKELAIVLSKEAYEVGLTARRENLLIELQKELPNQSYIRSFDISKKEAIEYLEKLIEEMEDVDLIVINSGIGFKNPELSLSKEEETTQVNVLGFLYMVNVAYLYFQKRGKGHITVVSSIAALRGGRVSPAYSASKAYISNYLEGLRQKTAYTKLPITITDIRPGFVDTDMTKEQKTFWLVPAPKAARQIYEAIKKKKRVAYISKRWRLIAVTYSLIPRRVHEKM